MRTIPSEFLSLLQRFRPDGVGELCVIDVADLPTDAAKLLVHDGDMTSRLEALHSDRICLDVLNCVVGDDGGYYREVVLRKVSDSFAVEYGVIEIVLSGFESRLRAEITEGKVPLGGILNRENISYFSEPQCFFGVIPNAWMQVSFGVRPSVGLYGRCNILKSGDGNVLARIVEVLPSLAAYQTVSKKQRKETQA
jgi:hypothetical protein